MLETRLRQAREQTLAGGQTDSSLAQLLAPQPLPAQLAAAIADCPGDWAITPELAGFLGRMVEHCKRRRVLEFGAGSSSVVLSTALSLYGGGELTSIEQNPDWCQEQWQVVTTQTGVDAQMLVAQPQLSLGAMGLHFAFTAIASALAKRAPFDLVLIDAPQYFFGRDGALPLIYPYLAADALIVLDDAGRDSERWAMFRWLNTYQGLTLELDVPTFSGKGLAVMRCQQALKPQFAPLSFVSGVKHTLSALRNQELANLRAKSYSASPNSTSAG
jgi:predicted O-methyltransferase YrrM